MSSDAIKPIIEAPKIEGPTKEELEAIEKENERKIEMIPIDIECKEVFLKIFEAVDLDKDGFIKMNDIMYSMLVTSPTTVDPDYRATQIFNNFDFDKDGKISQYEWLVSLSRLPKPTADQLHEFSMQFGLYIQKKESIVTSEVVSEEGPASLDEGYENAT